MFTSADIQEVIRVINYNYAFMIYSSLGEEVLKDEDRALLESYGVNIEALELQYPPYMQMFLLGRLSAILREQQTRQLSIADFKDYLDRGQFVPLSEREREEYRISREMTYNHLKGLGGKITSVAEDLFLKEAKQNIISTEISEGVKDRKSIQNIISEIGHKTEEWGRDWKRIVQTEMQNIYNQGRAAEIQKKYGIEQWVWKQVFPLACRHCIALYTTSGIGSEPRVFPLSTLAKNGDNIGVPVKEWKPIIGATHPHCRCDLRVMFKGQVWNEETESWEYPVERAPRVERKSRIKITVGEKEFYV